MSDKINPKEYQKKINKKTPASPLAADCAKAFFIGGIICSVGQVFMNVFLYFNLEKETASALVSVTLIFCGILLTGLDLYRKIAKHGGAGTLVPITGFSNAMSAPAIEAKTEGFVLGVGTKLFSIAGPVIVYGIFASVIAGIIMFVFNMY